MSNVLGKMTADDFKDFRAKVFNKMEEIIDAKNQDYTAGGGPFSNFELTEDIGINRLTGLTIRVLDKIQRLKSYTRTGKLAVGGEGIEDIFRDLIGYSFIALAMLEEDKYGS